MPLADILQWVGSGGKTGTLDLERLLVKKTLGFEAGTITSSWSNDPRESLGQFLVREGKITEEQLFQVLLRQEKEGRLMGSLLVSGGLITDEDLKGALHTKAEETIYDIFLWPDGSFEYTPDEIPKNVRFPILVPVTEIVLEGVNRVDEWPRMREVFPSPRTTFKQTGAVTNDADATTRRLLQLCDQGKSLAEIGLEMRRSEFATASLLFELHEQDLIGVDVPGESENPGEHLETISNLLIASKAQLRAHNFDAALAAYEQILALDRMNQDAKKGLIETIEARGHQRIAQRVPPHKVPVLKMVSSTLAKQTLDPQEAFLVSRINGSWDVRSLVKLCPAAEKDVLLTMARLLEKNVIELRD